MAPAATEKKPPTARCTREAGPLRTAWAFSPESVTVPVWTVVRPLERVPSRSERNDQVESVSIAEPMPTKPPPFL